MHRWQIRLINTKQLLHKVKCDFNFDGNNFTEWVPRNARLPINITPKSLGQLHCVDTLDMTLSQSKSK